MTPTFVVNTTDIDSKMGKNVNGILPPVVGFFGSAIFHLYLYILTITVALSGIS